MYAALFGSHARGSSDRHSDYDVIAVLEDHEIEHKEILISELQGQLPNEASVSIYSSQRLSQLWTAGSPFAWHLFLEHKPIQDYNNSIFTLAPCEYKTAIQDIVQMGKVMRNSYNEIISSTKNMTFEAGIQYVCARNIAMFASPKLNGQFNFSRNAPYALNQSIQFPLTLQNYSILTQARLSSTRGHKRPSIDPASLSKWSELLQDWIKMVNLKVSNQEER